MKSVSKIMKSFHKAIDQLTALEEKCVSKSAALNDEIAAKQEEDYEVRGEMASARRVRVKLSRLVEQT